MTTEATPAPAPGTPAAPETPATPAPETPAVEAVPGNPLATPPTTPVGEPIVPPAPEGETPPVPPVAEQPPPTEAPPTPDAEKAAERVIPQPAEYKLPDGAPPNLGEFAHKNNMTQAQLDNSIQQFGGYMQATKQAEQTALAEMGKAHLKNWGAESDRNVRLAKQALKQNDPSGQLAKALNTTGFGNHPAVLDFLFNLGQSMQEGGFLRNPVKRPKGEKSAAQAMFGSTHPSAE